MKFIKPTVFEGVINTGARLDTKGHLAYYLVLSGDYYDHNSQ